MGKGKARDNDKTLTIVGAMHAADGSGYYRYIVPFGELHEQSRHLIGMATPGAPVFQSEEQMEGCDVVSLQRPASKAGVRNVEKMAGNVAICYETDDDMFTADSSALPHLKDPKMLESIRRCIRLADIVSVSTPYLAETVRPLNENVYVLPNYVEEKLLRNSTHWRSDLDPDRRVKVGWAGGTSHLIDWLPYADGLRSVVERNPQADFSFAGFDYSPILGDLRHRATWEPWQDDIGKHYRNVSTYDIGLAPLADEAFCRSKSHLKALEYAAVGIPCVVTDLEPYQEFVLDGKTGFLVKTQEEFAARIHDLINDPEMRAEMGAAAKEHAADFTIQGNWQKYEAAYEAAYAIYEADN